MKKGAIICGGGYRYFTNAWVTGNLLRSLGWDYPVQLWMLEKEFSKKCEQIMNKIGVEVRVMDDRLPTQRSLPPGARSEWLLKPAALLQSEFNECLLLDADSNPIVNPDYLFDSPGYLECRAVFWPDLLRSDPNSEVWKLMGIEYRDEPEFESGQIVIDTESCGEPLELALWMNQRADIFYQHMWGDKETFRYAWHKYGRPFSMTPYPVQLLEMAKPDEGMKVMCQHDFDGNRIFQHRHRAKWDLLGENPTMSGCLYELECKEFVSELRGLWNGRVDWRPSRKADFSDASHWKEFGSIRKELTDGVWLLEDRRPAVVRCCAPLEEWSATRQSIPWVRPKKKNGSEEIGDISDLSPALRHEELGFSPDGVIGAGAGREFYFWDVVRKGTTWELLISGEQKVTAKFKRTKDGKWVGKFQEESNGAIARLIRVEHLYPVLESSKARKSPDEGIASSRNGRGHQKDPLHIANHALGIGDAVTGFYTATQIAATRGRKVVYHTRFPRWLGRAAHPDVQVTQDPPPEGTVDLNWDYREQLRYATDKVAWYSGIASLGKNRESKRQVRLPKLDLAEQGTFVNRSIELQRLDFPRYVIISPFATNTSRDWSSAHWQRLAWLLEKEGIMAVAIGTGHDKDRLSGVFDKTSACWAIDHSPEWVMDAMLGAEAVIGLDSGMIHVAGLLGVPAICIHSHLPPEFLFSAAPNVHSVSPGTDCEFCRWQKDGRFNLGCNASCSALTSIGPEKVMAMLESLELKQTRERFEQLRSDYKGSDPPVQERAAAQPRGAVADIVAYSYQGGSGIAEAAAINIAAMRANGLIVEQRFWKDSLERDEALMNPNQVFYHHWQPIPAERISNWSPADFGRARHIAYWTWETEDYVPGGMTELAPFMSEIWTPSSFCRNIFSKLGRSTFVLPHAVGAHRGRLPKLPCEHGDRPMVVLTIFDAPSRLARKNPFAAIRVFQKAFRSRLDVRLVIKTHNLNASQMREIQKASGFDSRVEIINEFLTSEALERLFASADVLLSLQRSEGFGLNLSKALGRGIPLVTTGWGGHLDFCDQESAFLVRSKLVPVQSSKDPWFVDGKWAEPNEGHAVAQLKLLADMIKNGDPELISRRRKGRDRIAREFSFKQLQSRIQKHFQKNFGLARVQ